MVVPEGNSLVPQQDTVGSGQPKLADEYRMMEELFDRWDRKLEEVLDRSDKKLDEMAEEMRTNYQHA